MKFVPRKELVQWFDKAYGGDACFQCDILAEAGETALEVLMEVLKDSEYLTTPLATGATIHFKLSVKE